MVAESGGPMGSNKSDKVDEVASGIDEVKTTMDELASDPPAGVEAETMNTVKRALASAGKAADEMEEQKD